MNRFFYSAIVAFFIMPLLVSAHGGKYLEFNPDKSSSLKVADVATPSEIFFVQNDFLGGFDFWLANPGPAGTATFSLLNEQGVVVAVRTVSIPTIALTSSGTAFHVDLTAQLNVLANDKYTIRITSSMPELRLYYSDRVQVISHNAPFASPYITGVGVLGSEEQYFSFKYALYETNETSAPIISNVSWSVISSEEMKLNFNTNEAVDYRLEYGIGGYGQGTDFLGDYEFCIEGISVCSITVFVLPNSTYQYRLTVKDIWGNQSQATGTFQSGQGQTPIPTPSASSGPTPTPTASIIPDSNPPIITNLRIVEVTDDSVSVAWTTDEPANSLLSIKYAGFISIAAVSDSTFELEHHLEINGELNQQTSYRAEVTSYDSSNNESQASISFATLSASPSPSPMISPIVPSPTPGQSPGFSQTPTPSPVKTSSSGADGLVEWVTSQNREPSDGYRVDVFDSQGNFVKTLFVEDGNSVEISGLKEGEYSVIVYENDDGVFKKVDKPAKLRIGDETFMQRLLKFWYLFVIVLAMIGYLIWKYFKDKSLQSTSTPIK